MLRRGSKKVGMICRIKTFWTALLILTLTVICLYIILQGDGSEEGSRHIAVPGLSEPYQYFHDTDGHSKSHRLGAISHADSRFASNNALDPIQLRSTQLALLRSYTNIMKQLGVESWIAHGTLLGWHWNKKLLPWDTDIDVQMSIRDLRKLAQCCNMTEYQTESGRHVLDINPHSRLVTTNDLANKIDARWIDMANGKFIDITAVHNDGIGNISEKLFCKDGHRYDAADVYPLKHFELEEIVVDVPNNVEQILTEEYGVDALTNEKFHWHRFNRNTMLWEYQGNDWW